MAEDKTPFRRASASDREILTNIKDLALRRQYARHLRDRAGVVFLPEEVDYRAFSELMAEDVPLRTFVEQSDDPYLVSEYLLRRYPHIFVAVEQVLEVAVDWMIRRTKRGTRPGDDFVVRDAPQIPADFYDRMSDDEIAMHVRRRLRTDVRAFNQDSGAYLSRLGELAEAASHQNERAVLVQLRALFQDLQLMEFPGFRPHIKGSASPFPSMHARVWIRQMQERGSALICGDVGTQKTSAAVVGLDLLGATRVIVCCPSLARLTWHREVPEYFLESPRMRVLEGAADLNEIADMSEQELHSFRYLVIGFGDLQCKNGSRWVETLRRYAPDGVIIDEAHAIKHDVARTRQVLALAQLPSVRHRVMLTATPFENSPNEVAILAMLLAPDEFPTREHFTAYCRDNPRFFFALMTKLMCEYFASEDVLDLPPANVSSLAPFPTDVLEPSRELTWALDMIRHDGALMPTEQIMRMNQLLACPFLGRDWYPASPHVNGLFRDPEKSVKLRWMRDLIAERIATGKVVVASGLYAAGVTRELEDVGDDPSDYVIADLLERWYPGQVVRIDGSMDASPSATDSGSRAEAIRRWREDPWARILVVSVQAAAESVDLTLRKVPSVERCTVLVLTMPWKPTQLFQHLGRFRRPGMEVPLEVRIPVVRGTVDEAMLEMNRLKWRNFLIGMMGIPLLDEETREIERRIMSKFIETDATWYGEILRRVRGMGEDRTAKLLSSRLRGKEVGSEFARLYLEREDCGLSGDVSRFCAKIYKPWTAARRLTGEEILDAACGPLVLERRLGEPVFGLDINPDAIAIGREHSYHGGKHAVVGRLSTQPEEWSAKFRLVVCALALHWSSNGRKSERLRILRELARVTAEDGILHILEPASCFGADEDAAAWTQAVEALGFERIGDLTGRVEASDTEDEPRPFWSICLRRTAGGTEDVDAAALAFSYERALGESKEVRGPRKRPVPPQTLPQVKHQDFEIATLGGAFTKPEVVAQAMNDSVVMVERLVREVERRYRPPTAFLRALRRSVVSHREVMNGEFSRSVWEDVFTRDDAPKVKRETLRAIIRQAMAG